MSLFFSQSPNLLLPLALFLLAFFISIHATGALQRLAWLWGIVDRPGPRKMQTSPVPYLGGLAIYLGLVVSLVIVIGLSDRLRWADMESAQAILLSATLVFLVGLADDMWGVPALVKLGALAVACAWLVQYGIGVNRTPWPWVNGLLTFLWVAGIASSFNAIDNTDGLAGAVALISAATLFLLGWATWQIQFSFLAMALAGGVLGFLHHNMNPAKIYMGDGGSFLLGFLLAVLVMFGQWSDTPWQSLAAGALVVAFPAYDLALTSWLRVRHGIVRSVLGVIAHSDTDHLSHRLRAMGYSHRRMLTVLGGLHAIGCLAALMVARRPVWQTAPALAVFGFVLIGFTRYVDRGSSRPGLWRSGSPFAPAMDGD